jgi:hypothetical protein
MLSGLACVTLFFQAQSANGETPIDMAWQMMKPARAGQIRGMAGAARPAQNIKFPLTSDPMEKLAIQAIEMNNRFNQRRDVSMKASTEDVADAKAWIAAYKAKSGGAADSGQTNWQWERSMYDAMVDKIKEIDMAGVTKPMDFFDPVGFTTELVYNSSGTFGQTLSTGKLLFYREVELKHGRVGMLASLGILVGEKFHPLFGGDIDVPAYLAFQQTPLQTFWPAVVAAIAIPETYSVFTFNKPGEGPLWTLKEGRVSGDFGFDPLGLKPKDAAGFKEMQNKELNNGRLAMLAAAGMIAQELVTGEKIF